MAGSTFVVGLTGGIASGKSTVAAAFAALGVPVIDADVVAREIVAPGSPALAEIVDAFGRDVLDADGSLDRRATRELVFADPAARARIDAITHPRIRALLRERALSIRAPYALLVIPLLIESGHYEWIDRILVVDVQRAVQRDRLLKRDGITEALADAMLDAQVSRENRLAIADDVIVNDGRVGDIAARVARLDTSYRLLASARGKYSAADTSQP